MTNSCDECGHGNDVGEAFCGACGQFLDWTGAEQSNAPKTTAAPPTEVLGPRSPEPPPDPSTTLTTQRTPSKVQRLTPKRSNSMRVSVAIDRSHRLATHHDRHDLAQKLEATSASLASRSFTVVVVGEFKRGKSTLINALLQTAVCPVDADVVTAVPTVVRYGKQASVVAHSMTGGGERQETREASLSDIADLVTESADPRNPSHVRSVEISVPHRMLRSGMNLVDTPGVGGLESVHGTLTLGALTSADGVLFVTDASQELTGPELSFLKETVRKCPRTALVMTKTDLHAQWRRIVTLDEHHLHQAGLDVPVIAVSSFLRLRSATDGSLSAEAGFEPLVHFLATAVVAPEITRGTAAAAADVCFVTDQLKQAAESELQVLANPEEAEAVVHKLAAAQARVGALTSTSATWQQTLADGVQDLVADVEHDLQSRLRAVLREGEAVIEEGDPKDAWQDTELWLRRQVAEVAVRNRDLLVRRAQELASTVADDFDLAADTELTIGGRDTGAAIANISLADSSLMTSKAGRMSTVMVAARSTAFVPMLVFGAAGPLGAFLIPIGLTAIALSAGLGSKLLKDEAKRQRTHRQQLAKGAARRFIDEVAFVMNKQSRDGLRDTQRRLRDEFAMRASILSRSSQASLDAAQQATRMQPADRAARAKELNQENDALEQVNGWVADAVTQTFSGASAKTSTRQP